MEEGKRPMVYKGETGPVAILILLVLAVGVYFLQRGISEHSATAYLVLGGLLTAILTGLGGFFVLFVLWIANRWEAARERREAERFKLNVAENLTQMTTMQKIQNQQNAMLLKQAKETTRLLPSPNSTVEENSGFEFDDALFDEID